jgi:hypothetical protein
MPDHHSILSCTRIKKGQLEYMVILQKGDGAKVEIPFSQETVTKLSTLFTDKTRFLVIGGKHNRPYGLPRKEWTELSHEAAIDYGKYGYRREKIETSAL